MAVRYTRSRGVGKAVSAKVFFSVGGGEFGGMGRGEGGLDEECRSSIRRQYISCGGASRFLSHIIF